MEVATISPKEYLDRKGIQYREVGSELIVRCIFNNCDADSREGEGHLYFNKDTGTYNCFKCHSSGNIITLAKYLGDKPSSVYPGSPQRPTDPPFSPDLVEQCHRQLPDHIKEYLLKERGLSERTIEDNKIGWGKFYRKNWITIPIKDMSGNFIYFKLRQDPAKGKEKITYPQGGAGAQIYGWETWINKNLEYPDDERPLIISEGELDRLLLVSKGEKAVTSTHGAGTFKEAWLDSLGDYKEIFVCFDNDAAGRAGADRVLLMLHSRFPNISLYRAKWPDKLEEGQDITDYIKLGFEIEDLYNIYSDEYPAPFNENFKPLTVKELADILNLTIKKDDNNKIVTFLGLLSAYTEDSQFNISFNAPSSTGKSFIPTEIARLFPQEDVMEIGYCSPTAFFHETGEFDEEKKGQVVDLSRKILIFLDQPHNDLLGRLRPLFSHDKKEISIKITDKNQKNGLRTKNVLLRGFPAAIFCTAGLRIDEQESTRFLLLSPEINRAKIQGGIDEVVRKENDPGLYAKVLEENPDRTLLKERIRAIKEQHLMEIKIPSELNIGKLFLKRATTLKPRHQRDIKRFIAIIKLLAVLNLWWRDRVGATIVANKSDVDEAFYLWEQISESQELGIPPYVLNIFKDVIFPLFKEKNPYGVAAGLKRDEIRKKYHLVYGRFLPDWNLSKQILPMLEDAGLVIQDKDPADGRVILVYLAIESTDSSADKEPKNVVQGGGVTTDGDGANDLKLEELPF